MSHSRGGRALQKYSRKGGWHNQGSSFPVSPQSEPLPDLALLSPTSSIPRKLLLTDPNFYMYVRPLLAPPQPGALKGERHATAQAGRLLSQFGRHHVGGRDAARP